MSDGEQGKLKRRETDEERQIQSYMKLVGREDEKEKERERERGR